MIKKKIKQLINFILLNYHQWLITIEIWFEVEISGDTMIKVSYCTYFFKAACTLKPSKITILILISCEIRTLVQQRYTF